MCVLCALRCVRAFSIYHTAASTAGASAVTTRFLTCRHLREQIQDCTRRDEVSVFKGRVLRGSMLRGSVLKGSVLKGSVLKGKHVGGQRVKGQHEGGGEVATAADI
jgi:hypothetical protein